ncbi:hypothetical protein SAMN05216188_12443 [Lentzea xinjiangensis]|uniref:Uncharacterized protein n=1 Tax=Lentzea xinjiangensis TaxID=402600 RepID=A0A1H9V5T1_9PSEU|nr:hypothetical protein [Lentzea xinjiangensis]SES16744.1 hypothetical protein SAMN05216188_12443 [Lentzea xinjiangensis]
MRFDVHDKLVDEPGRRAAIRWACRIDISWPRGRGVSPLLRLFGFLRYGSRMVWQGMDVFHFDAGGAITGKYSYADFKIPPMKRDRQVWVAEQSASQGTPCGNRGSFRRSRLGGPARRTRRPGRPASPSTVSFRPR